MVRGAPSLLEEVDFSPGQSRIRAFLLDQVNATTVAGTAGSVSVPWSPIGSQLVALPLFMMFAPLPVGPVRLSPGCQGVSLLFPELSLVPSSERGL